MAGSEGPGYTQALEGPPVGIQPVPTTPCGKSRIRIWCRNSRKPRGNAGLAEAALDDVFIDDITFPATDGYLLGATLFLPRGAKRHAVLINSATATPRRVYRGFAGYLARRGCAVLTYDYRGTGDSRQKAMTGYNQLKSLVGFKATMSDWAALDVAAAVAWMRERYNDPAAQLCRPFLRRPGAGAARQQHRGVARALRRGAGRLLEADGLAGALSRLCHAELRRPAADQDCWATRRAGAASARTCPRACSSNGSAGS